nr:hypothetical protein Ccrd_015829 [Ipomoea trifida]
MARSNWVIFHCNLKRTRKLNCFIGCRPLQADPTLNGPDLKAQREWEPGPTQPVTTGDERAGGVGCGLGGVGDDFKSFPVNSPGRASSGAGVLVFPVGSGSNPALLDHDPGVLVRVGSPLGRDHILLLRAGAPRVDVTVLENRRGVAENEVDRAGHVALDEELTVGVNVEGVLKVISLPTVAELKVVLPSTTFRFAVMMVFILPSPMNIKFVFLLGTSTFSLYTPALILITYLLLLLSGAFATASDTVLKFPLPSAATTTSGFTFDDCSSFLSPADNHSGQSTPSLLSFSFSFLLLLVPESLFFWFSMSVSVMFVIIARALLQIFSTCSWPATRASLTSSTAAWSSSRVSSTISTQSCSAVFSRLVRFFPALISFFMAAEFFSTAAIVMFRDSSMTSFWLDSFLPAPAPPLAMAEKHSSG